MYCDYYINDFTAFGDESCSCKKLCVKLYGTEMSCYYIIFHTRKMAVETYNKIKYWLETDYVL